MSVRGEQYRIVSQPLRRIVGKQLFVCTVMLLLHLDAAPLKAQAELPFAVTNNAVTAVTAGDRQYLVSFNGLTAGKSHADTASTTFVYDVASDAWHQGPDVPGGVGRLASAAVTVGELAFVFGGYSVAEDGSEVSTPWVHAFDPVSGRYAERAPMPVPVDDMLAVAYAERYIYLVSGWHDVGNVNLVQQYDTQADRWMQATPIPGRGVFGHAGGIVGRQIAYCDGVAVAAYRTRRRDFVANGACYLGLIDTADPRRIDWRVIDAHPGVPRYRMAAAGISELNAIAFVGGADNPYNYNGVGYDGRPAAPVDGLLLLDLDSLQWRTLLQQRSASMDHRGLVPVDGSWATIGGMNTDRTVSNALRTYSLR